MTVSENESVKAAVRRFDEEGIGIVLVVGADGKLRGIITSIESTLLQQLKKKNIDVAVVKQVAERLNDRMEACIEKLESRFETMQQGVASGEGGQNPASVLEIFEEDADEDHNAGQQAQPGGQAQAGRDVAHQRGHAGADQRIGQLRPHVVHVVGGGGHRRHDGGVGDRRTVIAEDGPAHHRGQGHGRELPRSGVRPG